MSTQFSSRSARCKLSLPRAIYSRENEFGGGHASNVKEKPDSNLEGRKRKIEDRLRARHESAGEISDARLEDFEKLTAAYEPPLELAPDLIKLSSGNAVSDTAKAVLLRLAGKQSIA
jgi:hypothetical protein